MSDHIQRRSVEEINYPDFFHFKMSNEGLKLGCSVCFVLFTRYIYIRVSSIQRRIESIQGFLKNSAYDMLLL